MKRFTILLLALIAFAVLKAEEKGAAEQACKCAEGDANCPCLAQAKSNTVITTNVNII
jgi:hypothetical protein